MTNHRFQSACLKVLHGINKMHHNSRSIMSFSFLRHVTWLQVLPSTMRELVGLIRIDLSHNQLRDVSMLSSLPECDIADWSYNELGSLPDDIERMKSLVELNVSNNQVAATNISIFVGTHHWKEQFVYSFVIWKYKRVGKSDRKSTRFCWRFLGVFRVYLFAKSIMHWNATSAYFYVVGWIIDKEE